MLDEHCVGVNAISFGYEYGHFLVVLQKIRNIYSLYDLYEKNSKRHPVQFIYSNQ